MTGGTKIPIRTSCMFFVTSNGYDLRLQYARMYAAEAFNRYTALTLSRVYTRHIGSTAAVLPACALEDMNLLTCPRSLNCPRESFPL